MIYKLIGAIIIIAASIIGFLTINEPYHWSNGRRNPTTTCKQSTPAEQLSTLIESDFENLKRKKMLPAQWSSIATIEYRLNSNLAKAILGKAKPVIQRVQNGNAYLELEIIDLPDDDNPGIIVQASLFDIKTKNKIFEIGRTYTMAELNKQAPQEKYSETQSPNKKVESTIINAN